MAELTDQQIATLENLASKNVHPVSEVDGATYFGLHIGPGGSGKTTMLGTLPGKALIIDAEGGTLSIREKPNVDVWTCADWGEFSDALNYFGNVEHDYDSLGIDGLSTFQLYNTQSICVNNSKDKSRPAEFMHKDWWGITLRHMRGTVNGLRAFQLQGIHVAVTVLEKETMDGDVIVQRIPDLQGQIKGKIAPMFDTVVYHLVKEHPPEGKAEHGKHEYRALTKPYGTRDLARDRWNVLEGVEKLDLENGDGISRWMDRIAEAVEDGAKPEAKASGSEPKVRKGKAAAKKGRPKKGAKASPEKKAAAKAADTPPEPVRIPESPEEASDMVHKSTQEPAGEPETPTEGDPPAELARVALAVQESFHKFVSKAPHLGDEAIKALTGALSEAGYDRLGEAVAKVDAEAVNTVAAKWTEFREAQEAVT